MPELGSRVFEALALLLEIAGVAVIGIGVVVASTLFVREGLKRQWGTAYANYRARLGKGILLGLEFLVGADIIATVTAPLTFQSLGQLAAVVAVRTFLSFALETEIEGCWPWQRRARREGEQ